MVRKSFEILKVNTAFKQSVYYVTNLTICVVVVKLRNHALTVWYK
jgi:hypothetical protein